MKYDMICCMALNLTHTLVRRRVDAPRKLKNNLRNQRDNLSPIMQEMGLDLYAVIDHRNSPNQGFSVIYMRSDILNRNQTQRKGGGRGKENNYLFA